MTSNDVYPRRVLFAVTGMSPQVVTETLWALIEERNVVPTEIRLVTTLPGRECAVRDLLHPIEGMFHRLCKDLHLTGRIRFDESCIIVISDEEGRPLEDIRTPEDNACAANVIMREIRSLCSDPTAQVHVSIAGGRKSMGFFAGCALSLFGRMQDSISHVLVSEPFEGSRGFFYPSPAGRKMTSADGEPLEPQDARVTLADIPFVRLREGLPDKLLDGTSSFGEAVAEAQAEMRRAPTLVLCSRDLSLWCSDIEVRLPPMPYVVYWWLAERAAQGLPPVRPGLEEAREILRLHRKLFPQRSGDLERAEKALRRPEDVLPYFQEKRSIIHRMLRRALGLKRADSYLIRTSGKRPFTEYSLALSKAAIRFEMP